MIEDIHYPAPQPEDHNRDEDPGFHEDLDIYIEFDDGYFIKRALTARKWLLQPTTPAHVLSPS